MQGVAEKLCEQDPQCVKFNDHQFFCDRHKRGAHVHKVVCRATWVRRTEDGERVVCRAPVTLTVGRKGGATNPKAKTGEPVCT